MTAPAARAQDITTDLVGHWALDDGTGSTMAADSSGLGNDMFITNMDVNEDWVAGFMGGAMDFDGDDDQLNRFDSDFNLGQTFTISAWVYLRSHAIGGRKIFCHGDCSTGGNQFILDIFSNQIRFQINDGGSMTGILTPAINFPTNEWHLLTATFGGGNLTLYMDGEYLDSDSGAPKGTSTLTLRLGSAAGVSDTTRTWDGLIDDARIYSRALSAEDVAALYAARNPSHIRYNTSERVAEYFNGRKWIGMGPSPVPTSGLVGHWKLDETSGAISDSSGYGNDGTASGGPEYASNGVIDYAMGFDGTDDYVELSGAAELNEDLTTFTYSVWIYPTGWGETEGGNIITQNNGDSAPAKQLRVNQSSPNASLRAFVDTGSQNASVYTAASSISLNEWQHIVMTYDGAGDNTIRIYKNGTELTYQSNIPGEYPMWGAAGDVLWIGEENDDTPGDEAFEGLIDDVRVYNRVLSAEEIAGLYSMSGAAGGYFVLIGNGPANDESEEFTGNLGGLSGANATCLSYLQTYDWKGKADAEQRGMLASGNVFAWLCDDGGCQDMEPGTQYAFATTQISMSGNGGTTFTADANGYYPFADANQWDGATHFNRFTQFWTGRDANNAPAASNCNDWTDDSSSNGQYGESIQNDSGRWSFGDQPCSTTDQFVCFVNPLPAQCSNPARPLGTFIYNASEDVMQFCNGEEWVPMGPVPGAGGAGCATVGLGTKPEGHMLYNADFNVMQYCDGANWVRIGGTGAKAATDGLIGYWKLDETSGTTALDSVGSSNGSLINGLDAANDNYPGIVGGALEFTASSDHRIELPVNAPADNFTISFWANLPDPDTTQMGIAYEASACCSGPDGKNFSLSWNGSYHTFRFRIWDGSSKSVYATTNPAPDTWYHITGVHDGSSISIYVNGVREAITAAGSAQALSEYVLGFEEGLGYFDGRLDDFRIYNRALNADEIYDLYLATGGN